MGKELIEVFHDFRTALVERTGDKQPVKEIGVSKRVWEQVVAALKSNARYPDSNTETMFCGIRIIRRNDDSDFVPVCTCFVDPNKCRRHADPEPSP